MDSKATKMTSKLILLFGILSLFSCHNEKEPPKVERPNIIIIYTDDMGIGDLSCYNSGWVRTPNIDQLAAEGLKFNHYYSASPVCSPSRAAVTTGIFPTQLGINTYLDSRKDNAECEQLDFLDPSSPSMARVLKGAGYTTGHFGKWHMGGGRDVDDAPQITEYGFDEYVSTYESPDADPLITATNWIWSEKDSIKRWERTGYFVDKTLDFLSRHKDSPCFVNFWPDDMHTPWVPGSDFYDKKETWNTRETFVQVLKEYDIQIGRLMKGLKELGIDKNTLVIFTSDNGPYPTFDQIRANSERGAKNSLFEAGINMPFIVRWSAKIKPGETDNKSVICSVDLLPSLCNITGAKLPDGFDYGGEDMGNALIGEHPQKRKKDLMWDFGRNKHFNHPAQPHHKSPHLAIRRGDWKLLVNSDSTQVELFDLGKDVNETTNVANLHPDITTELSRKVINWYRTKRKIRQNNLLKG